MIVMMLSRIIIEQMFYSDTDGDGYGIENGFETLRCTPNFHYGFDSG